jgi:TRAP transporter TAXI family solute receptor
MQKCIVTVSMVLIMTLAGIAHAADVKRFTIGTAGTAGALYPMGIAMAESITKHAPGLAATGEATAASVENIRNLSGGKLWMGISQAEIAGLAYSGEGDYAKRPAKDLRSMYSTIFSYAQTFVPADSPIESYKDFKGKNFGVGPAGSGGEMASRMLLRFYGLTYQNLRPQFIPDSESVSALKDGRIDGFMATHPLKSAALMDLTNSMQVKMLSIDDPAFYEQHPFYLPYTIPPGTYKGVDVPIVVPHSRVVMFTSTNSGLTDDDVYSIMKAVWEHMDEWSGAHASVTAQVTWDQALEGISVPLHVGAIRYFEERGVTIPKNLYPPEYKK